MATIDGSEVRYTLYDKVSRNFLDGWNFTLVQPCIRTFATFDQAHSCRREIMGYHSRNSVKSDIVIIKVSKVWGEVEGSY